MRDGLRREGGVFEDGFCWLSRADFCESMGKSVTDETVWEMEGGSSLSNLVEESIVG